MISRPLVFPAARSDYFAMRLLWRPAAFAWISPLRAARSRRLAALTLSAGVAPVDLAFLTAVRSAARWPRLRSAAARDFRMFFLADAIRGTTGLSVVRLDWGAWAMIGPAGSEIARDTAAGDKRKLQAPLAQSQGGATF